MDNKPKIDELFDVIRKYMLASTHAHSVIAMEVAIDIMKKDLERLGVAQLFDWSQE